MKRIKNKDENVHRFAKGVELYERERERCCGNYSILLEIRITVWSLIYILNIKNIDLKELDLQITKHKIKCELLLITK